MPEPLIRTVGQNRWCHCPPDPLYKFQYQNLQDAPGCSPLRHFSQSSSTWSDPCPLLTFLMKHMHVTEADVSDTSLLLSRCGLPQPHLRRFLATRNANIQIFRYSAQLLCKNDNDLVQCHLRKTFVTSTLPSAVSLLGCSFLVSIFTSTASKMEASNILFLPSLYILHWFVPTGEPN